MLPLKASRNEQRSVIRYLGPTGNGSVTAPSMQSRLSLSDYHLFGPKNASWAEIASDTEVQSTVPQWLRQQPASFIASDIQKLVDRWDKCLNEFG